MTTPLPVSIVIPTYRREQVLLDTLRYLIALEPPAAEIIVVDQSETHQPETARQLSALDQAGQIRLLKLDAPSIPRAMNLGLAEARFPTALFLDDDIRPEQGLVAAHASAHASFPGVLVAGRVIQPWEEDLVFSPTDAFAFAGIRPAWIEEFMGGNFSVDVAQALALGGFDENFVRVAYRFEAEFAFRFLQAGGKIRFEPAACLHHLKVHGGGTRTFGHHLTTWKPDHAVGAYYHAMRTRPGLSRLGEFVGRPLRAVATRHHLRRPWWIPVTLLAEIWGMLWALRLALSGPRYAAARQQS